MSRYGTVGGIVASSSDAYYVDHSENRDRLSPAASANLLAQNAALIAGTVSGIEGAVSPINQHGAIASFTAATFALSTEIDVFKEDVANIDQSTSNADRLTKIATVLGDVFTGLGNVVQILDSASEFDPALKPISALAEGYANILEIGGLTLTDPELVRETLAAGADAAATGVKNLIGEASTAIKGLFSAAKDSPDTSTGFVSDLDHMSSFALSAITKIDNGNSNINAQAFENIVNSVDEAAQNEFFNYIPSSAEIGERQIGTSDAAVLTSDGLYASGRLVFKDNGSVADIINLQDGTSQATAINLRGSVVTSKYAGTGGTGGLVEREINFQDGTSEVIVPDEISGYDETKYSGPNRTGDVISSTPSNTPTGGNNTTVGQNPAPETYSYVGNMFTTGPANNKEPLIPSNIDITATFSNLPSNFTGQLGSVGDSYDQPSSWSITTEGLTLNQSSFLTTYNFVFDFQDGQITNWGIDVNSANDVYVHSGAFSAFDGSTSLAGDQTQFFNNSSNPALARESGGYTSMLGTWTKQ